MLSFGVLKKCAGLLSMQGGDKAGDFGSRRASLMAATAWIAPSEPPDTPEIAKTRCASRGTEASGFSQARPGWRQGLSMSSPRMVAAKNAAREAPPAIVTRTGRGQVPSTQFACFQAATASPSSMAGCGSCLARETRFEWPQELAARSQATKSSTVKGKRVLWLAIPICVKTGIQAPSRIGTR